MSDLRTVIHSIKPEEIASEQAWIHGQVALIGQKTLETLVSEAMRVRKNAYVAYSHYQVGVALLTVSGGMYASCNAEWASYSETDHGEESTITKAISEGEAAKNGRRFIRALAVVHKDTSAPCGRCRQIIAEHCDDCVIVLADENGNIHTVTSLRLIFPLSFSPTSLGMD